MPVNTTEIIELLSKVADEEKMRVTLKETIKGGFIVGVMAGTGGFILGPLGFAVCGTVGGCIAAALARNKFQSAITVIANMEPEKKEMLAQNIRRIMADVNVADIVLFSAMVAGQPEIRKQVIHAIANQLQEEISKTCVNH